VLQGGGITDSRSLETLSLILRFGGLFRDTFSEFYNSLATASARRSIRCLSLASTAGHATLPRIAV